MKSAQFHQERLEASSLYKRRTTQAQRTAAIARLKALEYLDQAHDRVWVVESSGEHFLPEARW